MPIERHRELRRRRRRQKKLDIYARRAKSASPAEKASLAHKIRSLTPGAEIVIERLGLSDQ